MLNFYDTKRVFERLTLIKFQPLLKEIGKAIRDSIQAKTSRGVDTSGKRFSPYTPIYRRMKAFKGLYPPVNLKLTGQMLGDLSQTENDRECRVGFKTTKSAEKATYNQEGSTPRHFFDISPEANKEIDKLVNEFINDIFKGI